MVSFCFSPVPRKYSIFHCHQITESHFSLNWNDNFGVSTSFAFSEYSVHVTAVSRRCLVNSTSFNVWWKTTFRFVDWHLALSQFTFMEFKYDFDCRIRQKNLDVIVLCEYEYGECDGEPEIYQTLKISNYLHCVWKISLVDT